MKSTSYEYREDVIYLRIHMNVNIVWMSGCCLTSAQPFFSYIMTRTS